MHNSPLASRKATTEIMERWGLYAKKSLGQNFLVDDGIVGKTLSLAGLDEVDEAVVPQIIEVGPGIGTLTVAMLARGARVMSIERDESLPPILAETTAQDSERFMLIEKDALKLTDDDLAVWFGAAGLPAGTPFALVSNLPYAVAATIILDYFERFDAMNSATVMVQAEVADRIAARPGTKNYGAYTVKLRLFAEPVGQFPVSRGCFFPQPHVDSAVIRLNRRAPLFRGEPASDALIRATSRMADAAFTQRRKTIRNSMRAYFGAGGLDVELVDTLLEAVDIEPTRRGETLSLEEFLALGEAFLQRN